MEKRKKCLNVVAPQDQGKEPRIHKRKNKEGNGIHSTTHENLTSQKRKEEKKVKKGDKNSVGGCTIVSGTLCP